MRKILYFEACLHTRFFSSNGRSLISSFRYGFPLAPELGSFARYYRPKQSSLNLSDATERVSRVLMYNRKQAAETLLKQSYPPVVFTSQLFFGNDNSVTEHSLLEDNRVNSLEKVFLDDAGFYIRALVFASRGTRNARDWIAGLAAAYSSHPFLLDQALQCEPSLVHLQVFKNYCDIITYNSIMFNDHLLSDLDQSISPLAHGEIIKRCFVYDAMTAIHFLERDVRHADVAHLRSIGLFLQVGDDLIDKFHDVVHEEQSIIQEKKRTLDTLIND